MGMGITWITDAVAGHCPSISPDAPALAIGGDAPLSYGQLRDRELTFARALEAAGVRKGDRVALLLQNCTDYVAWYLAIGRVGAISVRLNWRLTAPELQFQLQDSGTSVLIFGSGFRDVVGTLRGTVPVTTYVEAASEGGTPEWVIPLDVFLQGQGAGEFAAVGADDPLTIMYTSGTTGRPKGAVLTHGNAMWIGAIQRMNWKFDSSTVAMTMGPLFHAGGFEVLLLPALLSHGTAVTYPSGSFSLETMLRAAREQSATVLLLYSFMLNELASVADIEDVVPETLERIVTGGDTILPSAYEAIEQLLPFVNLTQSYSLTEGGAVAVYLDHSVARGRESSVGQPQPFTEVKVVGLNGDPVAPGEVGEIHLRSPGVAVGYWNRPDATAETFVDGWCRTGDLGRVDRDGFLTLAGRAKDMIRSGGENIYPAELEKLLSRHPGVHDVAVVGVPDEKYVEVGCAVVVPEPGTVPDAEGLRSFLADQLARYKVPKHFAFVEDLPRNAAGKVLKFKLRDDFAHLGGPRG